MNSGCPQQKFCSKPNEGINQQSKRKQTIICSHITYGYIEWLLQERIALYQTKGCITYAMLFIMVF